MTASSGFFPGDGVGIVVPTALVLLEHAAGDVVPALLTELDRGGRIDGLLELLAGSGLRTVGSFAIAVDEGDALRVLARGDAWVRIDGEGETATFDGAGLRTWNEQLVSGWAQVAMGLGERIDPPSLFEVDRGVVPAGGLVRPNAELAVSAQPDETDPVVAFDLHVDDAAPESTAEPIAAPPDAPESGVELTQVATTDEPALPRVLVDAAETSAEDPTAVDPSESMVAGEQCDPSATLAVSMIASVPAADPQPVGNDYDDIFGRTVVRSVQDAAVHSTDAAELATPPAVAEVPDIDAGDHDGHTITLSQLREMQQAEAPHVARLGDHDGMTISVAELRKLQAEAVQPSAPTASAGVTVQALVCAAGHPSPTHASTCGRCGGALGPQPVIVPRPVLGRLVLSNGEVVELDRSAIIGRNPKIEGRLVGELPKIVRLDAFQGVSRSHAMVRLEGWQVLLVDLGSANHTTVRLPGRPPQRLHPDEPVLLGHGAHSWCPQGSGGRSSRAQSSRANLSAVTQSARAARNHSRRTTSRTAATGSPFCLFRSFR